jgi:hypothetical protein
MTVCAVIDSNNQLVNMIVAEPTIEPPEGCTLVEIPLGMYWDGTQVSPRPVVPEE